MKRVLLMVVLMGLSGCSVMREAGTALCSAQEQTATVISKGGALVGLGGLGPMASDIVNTGLEFFCTVFDAVVSAPANVSDELGLTIVPEAVADAPPDTPPGV